MGVLRNSWGGQSKCDVSWELMFVHRLFLLLVVDNPGMDFAIQQNCWPANLNVFLAEASLMRAHLSFRSSFWISLSWSVGPGFMIIELARLYFLDNTLCTSRGVASLAWIRRGVLLLSNLPSFRQSITEWLLILSSILQRIDVTEPTSLKDHRIQWVPESRSSTTNITRLL